MPWKVSSTMSLREAFIHRAQVSDVNFASLCREFGISRKTGYKWLARYQQSGVAGLKDRSRRPHHSPNQTPAEIEQLIVSTRQHHPRWGARKLRAFLSQQGHQGLPAASTITAILRRYQLLDAAESPKHRPYKRFERQAPNQLWQMDFKGEFALTSQQMCYPLTLLDDHSRFSLGVFACADTAGATIQPLLVSVFREYGLPDAVLMDNGSPWGNGNAAHTYFSVWLMQLDIQVLHGRAYHPQTQGKIERFHRSLKAEVLEQATFRNFRDCQTALNHWRTLYNTQRPHEAVDDQPPITRYQCSARPYPETLPPISYPADATIRKVNTQGRISFRGRLCPVGGAFRGLPVAIYRHHLIEGVFDVYFRRTRIAKLDFNSIKYPLS